MSTILFSVQTTPSTPSTDKVRIFFDQADNKLKSIDENGVVTTYTTASTLINYRQSSTSDTTTTSTTDVLMDSMSITTPSSGKYLVNFSCSTVNSGNGAERNWFSIYAGGVQVSGTERSVGVSGAAISTVSISDLVSVNGSQDIAIYWRVAAGTGTGYDRILTAVRVDN